MLSRTQTMHRAKAMHRFPRFLLPASQWPPMNPPVDLIRVTSVVLSSTNRKITAQAITNWYALAVTLGAERVPRFHWRVRLAPIISISLKI